MKVVFAMKSMTIQYIIPFNDMNMCYYNYYCLINYQI